MTWNKGLFCSSVREELKQLAAAVARETARCVQFSLALTTYDAPAEL